MSTARLSSKGQVVIPKEFRDQHGWDAGTEFTVSATADGLLLSPVQRFPATTLDDVVGCLQHLYDGPAKSIDDMRQAAENEVVRRHLRATSK
jgi:AbrB family looped-hinge helix DNA binding protein